ncbi:MAG: hypothetical protein SV186_04565 [Candidatus Nanohaloarchaea archaeon]|nr:hypothetical protein [Candidatus Nanohaloarchaea archaeon]
MDVEKIRYMVLATAPDYRVRAAAIAAVFADTVTTIYLLYLSGLSVTEFNPLAMLARFGFVGEVLFMAVPLFAVMLLLYLPGILGDAVGLSNVFVHLFAAGINISHLFGMPLEHAVGVSAQQAYIFAITASSGIGALWYLPRMRDRMQQYQSR